MSNHNNIGNKSRGKLVLLVAFIMGALTLTACSSETSAQTSAQTSVQAITENEKGTIEHTLKSLHPKQGRVILVKLPSNYENSPDRRYPVLYLLDGDQNLDIASSVVSALVESAQIPEMIIVGLDAGKTRGKDYLPKISDPNANTGARRYLEHVEKELLPFVDSHYRTSSFRLLSGHSWGGLFSTYAMTEKPTLFDGFLAQSPMITKKRRQFYLTQATHMMTQNPDLSISYSVAIGDERKLEPRFNQLVALFEETAPATFRLQATRHTEASHMQTREPGMRQGLIHAFAEEALSEVEE